jgi:hypothetical protein
MTRIVSLLLVLLHYRARRHFFGSLAVAPRFLRILFDVLVLALLFTAHTAQVVTSGHETAPLRLASERDKHPTRPTHLAYHFIETRRSLILVVLSADGLWSARGKIYTFVEFGAEKWCEMELRKQQQFAAALWNL